MIPFTCDAILSAEVGTKARNLGLLCRLSPGRGWVVPRGGALTVQECSAFLQDSRREEEILRELKAADLASGVAVRSSARMEDMFGRSAAGQFKTLLGVSGAAELSVAIRSVVRSYSSDAARSYGRITSGDTESGGGLGGVIVQQMVTPRISGATFARRSEVVIEAVWGLGEALMAGEVTPAHYSIDTKTETVTCRPAPLSGAGPSLDRPDATVLELDELFDVYEAGVGLRQHFGGDQEIEWAFDSAGQLYLLQVRPLAGGAEEDI